MRIDQDLLAQFPILETRIRDRKLVYLDSAATSLKPRSVAQALFDQELYRASNVHRGVHTLSDQATQDFEAARAKVSTFVNSGDAQVVLTHGTTESINIVANGISSLLSPGDEIVLTELEHHSNIVPWQMAAKRTGASIIWAEIDANGVVTAEAVESKLSPRTKVIAISGMSNTLGTLLPIHEICSRARKRGIFTLVDAAQLVTCREVDFQSIGCDFLVFSGHKIFGPTGVGVLVGRKDSLERLEPLMGGGAMISKVSKAGTTYLEPPFRFEAGTPPIAPVIGLGAAIEFLSQLQWSEIKEHEDRLLSLATQGLSSIPGVRIFGLAESKGPILSFVIDGLHHHDIGSVLDQQGVAVRAGHHCTQPLMEKLGVTGTVRASFSIYNTEEDAKMLVESVHKARKMLG